MKDIPVNQLSMHTTFLMMKEGETANVEVPLQVGRACFFEVKIALREQSKCINQIKYFPWTADYTQFDLQGWTERWLKTTLSIPFIKRSVIDYTGYDYGNYMPREKDICTDKYFHIDFSCVDEAFVTCSVLRIPQEFPHRIKLFSELVDKYGDLAAWIASLYFNQNSEEATPETGAHNPCNYIDLGWWSKFYRDPSVAKSLGGKWNNNLMGGSVKQKVKLYSFLQGLVSKDPAKHDVAVYGSLREGMGNHFLLSNAIKEGRAIKKFGPMRAPLKAKMYDTGFGFPALVVDKEVNNSVVEIYTVNDQTLKELDILEGYPTMYDRAQVSINDKSTAWLYFQKDARDYSPVRHGDWFIQARGVA